MSTETLREARTSLNMLLNAFYKTSEILIVCTECGRSWSLNKKSDGTASARIEHDETQRCGIAQKAMYACDREMNREH